jgi:hypothetical protein
MFILEFNLNCNLFLMIFNELLSINVRSHNFLLNYNVSNILNMKDIQLLIEDRVII